MSMVIYTVRFWDDSGDESLPIPGEVENAVEGLANECECEFDVTVEDERANEYPADYPRGSLRTFIVRSDIGERNWQAEDADHAREQHVDAFPDEPIYNIREA